MNPFTSVKPSNVSSLVANIDAEDKAALDATRKVELERRRVAVAALNLREAEDSDSDLEEEIAGSKVVPIDVELGLLEKFTGENGIRPQSKWRLWHGGKVGGRPVWLHPKELPSFESVTCSYCSEPLLFLSQIYAPVDDTSFHRSLYVFCCRRASCLRRKPGGFGAVRVLRAQLPSNNPFISTLSVTASPHSCENGSGPLRIDPVDGEAYTKASFIAEYGGTTEWDAALEVITDEVTELDDIERKQIEAKAELYSLYTKHIELALVEKQRGNDSFKQGKWEVAIESYTTAMDLISKYQAVFPIVSAKPGSVESLLGGGVSRVDSMDTTCPNNWSSILLANRALARIKMIENNSNGDFDANDHIDDNDNKILTLALHDADAAVVLRPGWYKAHFRRAQILTLLGRQNEASIAEDLVRRLKKQNTISTNINRENNDSATTIGKPLLEYELFCEPEPDVLLRAKACREQDAELEAAFNRRGGKSAEDIVKNAAEKNKNITRHDLREAVGDAGNRICDDAQVRTFQRRMTCCPKQCVRYSRWEANAVLWASSERQLLNDNVHDSKQNNIVHETKQNNMTRCPPCNLCGAPRKFEFQLMPQLLHFCKLGIDDGSMDWDTLVVYSCSKSCNNRINAKSSYTEEFGWIQTSSKNFAC